MPCNNSASYIPKFISTKKKFKSLKCKLTVASEEQEIRKRLRRETRGFPT